MAAAPESASWPTAEPGYLVGRGHAGDDLVDVVDLFVASFGQDVLAGGVVRFGQLGTPKSHQSRTVPLPRFVAVELAAGVDGKRPDDLVFTMPGGSVMRLSNWRYVTFLPARARAGLSDRFRIHDLRHTAASLMIQAGYPPKMLQEIMGHASITTTLDLYGHLYPGEMDRYADRLGTAAEDAAEDIGRAKIRLDEDEQAGK
jgi:hypothetical protein